MFEENVASEQLIYKLIYCLVVYSQLQTRREKLRFKVKFNPFKREIVRRKCRFRATYIPSSCVQLITNQERKIAFQSKI